MPYSYWKKKVVTNGNQTTEFHSFVPRKGSVSTNSASESTQQAEKPVTEIKIPNIINTEPKIERKIETFSIKNALKGVPKSNNIQVPDSDIEESLDDELIVDQEFIESAEVKSRPLTLENLKYFLTQFAKRFEQKDIRLFNILSTGIVEIKNGSEVHLGVYNSLQIDELERIKFSLTGYLANNLEDRSITISPYIIQSEDIQKPLSSNDKFDLMVKKNENLRALKQRLNLDFD